MDEYLTWLLDLSPWHWLALGVALGGLEMVSLSFFLLFPAISAGLVGGILYIEPDLDWRVQVLIFAVLSVVTTMLGRAWLRKFRGAEGPMLVNIRGQSFTGRQVRLADAMENGQGRVQLGDTWWHAESVDGQTIPAEVLVEITDVDGTTVKVRAIEG